MKSNLLQKIKQEKGTAFEPSVSHKLLYCKIVSEPKKLPPEEEKNDALIWLLLYMVFKFTAETLHALADRYNCLNLVLYGTAVIYCSKVLKTYHR